MVKEKKKEGIKERCILSITTQHHDPSEERNRNKAHTLETSGAVISVNLFGIDKGPRS